jgi:ABC-type sugar transport system ATPase subunit
VIFAETHHESPAVDARELTRIYGGTVALNRANLTVHRGEIHGLLGENGAGKSTMVRILAGVEQANSGSLRLFGHDANDGDSSNRLEMGCAFIHQDLALIPELSIADNIALTAGYPKRGPVIDDRALRNLAVRALAALGLDVDVSRPVGELPIALQTIVAISRAVTTGAALIVLDEPTAKLQAGEVHVLLSMIEQLRIDHGVAFVLISHRLSDIDAVCDQVTVLRNGRTVASESTRSLSADRLIELIVGKSVAPADRSALATTTGGEVLFEAIGATTRFVGPVDVQVRAGRVCALTGLQGAGHLELAAALYGTEERAGSPIRIAGRDVDVSGPAAAAAARIGYLPPDRTREGCIPELDATENFFLNAPADAVPRRLSGRVEATRAAMHEYDVRPPEPARRVSTFSGGNQQKLILARLLERSPLAVILCEPTAGVDVGAKLDIWQRLRELATTGRVAVLVASSDFEEVEHLADDVVVLRNGKVAGSLHNESVTLATITSMAYGGEL